MTSFPEFFVALWGYTPFPWQATLAEMASQGNWPKALDLPTASGKTACLDAALYGLAATAAANHTHQRMPRRIWFVVDRRIVVDEAFERANMLARKLMDAQDGPIREIADALRSLSGGPMPVATAKLRGGSWRGKDWSRWPTQPTIICSTVDQVGSALLFRAYGHSPLTSSIYAGLAANDSLILVDEAHCALPFCQTLSAIEKFRSSPWASAAIETPFRACVMSATPPINIPADAIFPQPGRRAAALDHPVLRQRMNAHKPAALLNPSGGDHAFVAAAVTNAADFCRVGGAQRVAIMVNRVATAMDIHESLAQTMGDRADVVLITGRMRPIDRDLLTSRWSPWLKAGAVDRPPKPIIVVTTQCLEVGADFSFDALITECASLDALRQRFGRLNRFGAAFNSQALILTHTRDTLESSLQTGDPIYGTALNATWRWLNLSAGADGKVDFGVSAMHARLSQSPSELVSDLMAPAPDAPILLASHLDLLCQTAPRPLHEPDIGMFLHGKERGAPDVRVVFRADLPPRADDVSGDSIAKDWIEALTAMPPCAPEMLTVPKHAVARWLTASQERLSIGSDDGDVVGAALQPSDSDQANTQEIAPFLLWRGPDESRITRDPSAMRPNDVVVVRLEDFPFNRIAPTVPGEGLGADLMDLAERARRRARATVCLRLHAKALRPWAEVPAIAALFRFLAESGDEAGAEPWLLNEQIDSVLHEFHDAAETSSVPAWLRETASVLIEDGYTSTPYLDGLLVTGLKKRPETISDDAASDLSISDGDDASRAKEEVSLADHTSDVHAVALDFAARALPPGFQAAVASAAVAHDLGKLDRRFQILLRNGDDFEIDSEPLAKSARLPRSQRRRLVLRNTLGLPTDFRHEFLSLQLAQHLNAFPEEQSHRDCTLHLIASHHGHARPCAPVRIDPALAQGAAGEINLTCLGIALALDSSDRQRWQPAHHLAAGVPERFWRLNRQFGWWGLAYLEAVFRLADWEASRKPLRHGPATNLVMVAVPAQPTEYLLPCDAIDGANPLGFMAALGTLRLLANALPEANVRLSWRQFASAWRPCLHTSVPMTKAQVANLTQANGVRLDTMFTTGLLSDSLAASPKNKKGAPAWLDKLKFPLLPLRAFMSAAAQRRDPGAEFAGAWSSEIASEGDGQEEVGKRTRFDFTAGQQALIAMLRELGQSCTSSHIEAALFNGWDYKPGIISLRWDPQDEKRQYALQASDPTDAAHNPGLAECGANFLAVEALPLFSFVPNRAAGQPGFCDDRNQRSLSWPVWEMPLSLDAIRGLLTDAAVDSGSGSVARRRALGLGAVFRSSIVMPSGRYRCFTPARPA